MKVEINEEKKGKFLANYIECEMELPKDMEEWYVGAMLTGVINGGTEIELQTYDEHLNGNENPCVIDSENAVAILKSLSDISDEDAAIIHKGHTAKSFLEYYSGNLKQAFWGLSHAEVDYLRSRGYLLPYMGLTTDEIINAGWAKIKTNQQ